jgi:hypothetical protein
MPWQLSNSVDPMYYSFDIGKYHFVGFNTETFIDTADIDPRQQTWLANVCLPAVVSWFANSILFLFPP